MKIEPAVLLGEFQSLAATVPVLGSGRQSKAPTDPATLHWLGRLVALIRHQNNGIESISLNMATSRLGTMAHDSGVSEIMQILYRGLADAELYAPAEQQGKFIAVGSVHDGYAAVLRTLKSTTKDVLVVDPYLDSKFVNDFAVGISAGAQVNLLSDKRSVYPDLLPAIKAYREQYGQARPIEARLTAKGALHDRLMIIDQTIVWDLSQSIKDFAARSPATLQRPDADLSARKAAHYFAEWENAEALV